MTATTMRRLSLSLALTAALLVAALVLIGRAGADDGDGLAPPAKLRITTEQGSLDASLDWEDVEGASSYRVRWRESGPGNKLNAGIEVDSSEAVITVARYGEWVVRVQACDDAGCGEPNARKFKVRRPRAMPDITPLPTATLTPLPTSTPTPLPTATPTPPPTASGELRVSVTASSATVPANQSVSLAAAVSNPPAGYEPSYQWELSNGGDWHSHGTRSTLSYLAVRAESWSFRVTVTYGSGDSATSEPLTVAWVDIPPTPTVTPVPLPTSTPIPMPEPTATPTPGPSVPIPDEPTGLSVSATPGSLEVSVDWDDVSGASYYWVRWRESGPGKELNEGVVVLPSVVVVSVDGYGEWMARAQACNAAGCGAPGVSKFSVEPEPIATPTSEPTATPTPEPEPLGQPQNFVVSAEPGTRALLARWDDVEEATSYKVRWRESGGEFETANAATVSDTILAVTVPDYGRWDVRAQGCNEDGCGPEASATADVVKAASLRLERARPRTIAAAWDVVEGAESYTLSWRRIGADQPVNIQAPAQSAAVRQARSAVNSPDLDRPASLSSGQRENVQTNYQLTLDADRTSADLSVPDDGAYRVDLEAVGDGNELIAMASNHVDQAPGRPDTTPPRLEWGEIDGNRMRLYFSEPLNENVAVARFDTAVQYADCICMIGGAGDYPVEVSGNVVTVGLGRSRVIAEGLAYTSYISGLRDLAGNKVSTPKVWYDGSRTTREIALRNITGLPEVTNVVLSSDPGADRFYMVDDTIRVKINFSEAVDVTGTPRLKIDLDPADGGERWAAYSGGSGTRDLEFSYTVAAADISTDGVAVIENTLAMNGGAIRAEWAIVVEDARLGHKGLRHNPAHRVVTAASAAPLLQSASVSSTTLTLTFSEPLGAAASLSNDVFTVKKTPQGGTEREVDLSGTPAISGSTVTLTLASAALGTDERLKVSYTRPSTGSNNKLVDVDGSEVADFTDEPVKNSLDTMPPRLVRGEMDGDVITAYFSEPLDEDSPSTGIWEGDIFRLALRYTQRDGQCPASSSSFSARPREVYVKGNAVVVVGLTRHEWQWPTVGSTNISFYYITNTAFTQRLRDLSGNPVSTPYHDGDSYWSSHIITLDNVTRPPWPKTATVNGKQLTLTFSAPMDGDSKPAASAFTVKVNGSQVDLDSANPVSMTGREVTLTLAAAVAAGDAVTVSYDKPDSRWLRNSVCDGAPSFTDVSVTNSTP